MCSTGVFSNLTKILDDTACNVIKRETLAQVFFCEFCEVFKNTIFTEHLLKTASEFTYESVYKIYIIKL